MDTVCVVCLGNDTVWVRERKPGSKGHMSQSFDSRYDLCRSCLAKCQAAGCIERWEDKSRKPRRQERVTVFFRTREWLKGLRVSE